MLHIYVFLRYFLLFLSRKKRNEFRLTETVKKTVVADWLKVCMFLLNMSSHWFLLFGAIINFQKKTKLPH